MRIPSSPLIFLLLALSACSSGNTRRAPALSNAPSLQPARPNPFEEAGDTAWRVVTAPAHIIAAPKQQPRRQPETFDPPAVIMTPRAWADSPQPAPPAPPGSPPGP